MTFKDKPKRPGTKPAGRDTKPRGAASATAGKKSFSADKPAGKKPFGGKSAPRDGKPARAAKPAPAAASGADLAPERISKLLARAGIASRRDIERMIMEGRVSVNGKVLETPVLNATFADHIEVDGVPVRGIERTRLWLYHKPAGLVTTNADPEGRPTVFENLPEDLPRVMSVGRLDINTEGLLLLTNDGGLARMLELPTTGWLRRYRVRAHGKIEQADLDKLKEGIAVDGVLYGAIDATLDKAQGSNVWLTLGLREGKNREVKNVLGALGLDVNRLIRISYGPFQLGELPEGHAQEIRGRTLRDQLGPRLIEESKANFDAPLFDHKVEDEDEKKPAKARAEAPAWSERPAERREKSGDRREQARARLDTRRDDRFGDKPRGGPRDRDRDDDRFDSKPKREPANRARKSNVWMAPGARPVAEKKADAAEGVKREPRERPEGAPKSKRYGRTADGGPTRSAKKFDPDRKGYDNRGPARGRPGDDRAEKPRILKTRDEDGEWIRASDPETGGRDDGGRGGFGRKRSGAGDDRAPRNFGDRTPRDDRRPRAEGDRPFGDRKPRAQGERSFGDRTRGDGERSFGDRKPRADGERTFSDRPPRRDGGKPFGGKPGGKSFGGKPGGGRPSGGKPSGGRPAGGGRPRGKGK